MAHMFTRLGFEKLRHNIPTRLRMIHSIVSNAISDTVLWQSYKWFVPLIALLTIEWIIRKRGGML